jgi:error-prone DNA polymerase
MKPYVELHARSAFSFLRGASHPEQLVERAAQLGLPALALCDRDGLYGAPRLRMAGKEHGVRAIVGAELTLDDGSVLPVLAATHEGYRNLSTLITRTKLRAPGRDARAPRNSADDRPTKAGTPVRWDELAEFSAGLVALTGDEEGPVRRCLARDDFAGARECVQRLRAAFGEGNLYLEVQRHLLRGEELMLDRLVELARTERLPLLATNGPLHATRDERAVLDVFTCARHHTHLDAAGRLLSANDERHLKSAAQMARLFADVPEAIENTAHLAERLAFSLDDLGYEFPRFDVPAGESMETWLRKMTYEGARRRYGEPGPRVVAQLEHELALITRLGFAGYFLIVWDLVNFCTAEGILVQGRGSAANSAVCYSLGITACDPIAYNLLFERFLSEGRTSWPDIDLDLPSGDRRERVIQEVYRRYGERGAAMTANVITFRGRSAMREIGKALNFPPDTIGRFSSLFGGGDYPHTLELDAQLRQAGIPPEHPRTAAAIALYRQIYGLPRHLGQHSGGMIICQGMLDSVVPLEHAAMPGRVVAQWDKDDCADLGIIKVDLLGLGMMAAMQDAIELCRSRAGILACRSPAGLQPAESGQGCPHDYGRLEARPTSADFLAAIPADDPATYDLMCAADTIGVFQIESRAQMATLPRMKPRRFYDVVVEVAIIRPGPIQGGMLHPYLERRAGRAPVTYFDERLRPVLERTLGVPLFQEQLLKIAMVMADFTGSQAEELRRALSFHRSQEKMEKVCVKLRDGMARKGVAPEVMDQIVKSVQSFAVYGFPESHAISFALIAYASTWMKVHRAPEFYASLLNNQPMGFYSPATLVKDAKRRGVRVRSVSVIESEWRCTVGEDDAIRLGLCMVQGLRQEHGERIAAARPFRSLADFQLRTQLSKRELRTLAKIGALNGLAAHRRDAQWKVEVARAPDDLFARAEDRAALPLRAMSPFERTQADYLGTGLTTGPHPMALIRARVPDLWRAADLAQARSGVRVRIGGHVICRQRPGTAKGFVFVSVEDETGVANAILEPDFFEKTRLLVTEEPFLIIEGLVQHVDGVIHIKARALEPLRIGELATPASHDFQ